MNTKEFFLENITFEDGFVMPTDYLLNFLAEFMNDFEGDERLRTAEMCVPESEDLYLDCTYEAVNNFKKKVKELGVEGMLNDTDSLVTLFFLREYMDDWENSEDLNKINMQERFFNNDENDKAFIDYAKNHPGLVETDKKKSEILVENLYRKCFNEAMSNFDKEQYGTF